MSFVQSEQRALRADVDLFLHADDVERLPVQQAHPFFDTCPALAFVNKAIPRKAYLNSEMLDLDYEPPFFKVPALHARNSLCSWLASSLSL